MSTTPMFTDDEIQLAFDANNRVRHAFTTARREFSVYDTGIDMHTLGRHYPNLADVSDNYFNGARADNSEFAHTLTRQPNPLEPFLTNLERRHR